MEQNNQKKNSASREIVEWVVSIVVAVALALTIHTWVGQLVIVDGPSMEPGLQTGERVLMGKLEYHFRAPRRGDIVVVHYPDSSFNYIKRVVATEGEHISIADGSVFIDGRRLDEPYIAAPIVDSFEETVVPPGTVFVMGDNRNDSSDSRSPRVGAIPLEQVVGRVYALVWPVGKWQKLTGYSGALAQP